MTADMIEIGKVGFGDRSRFLNRPYIVAGENGQAPLLRDASSLLKLIEIKRQ